MASPINTNEQDNACKEGWHFEFSGTLWPPSVQLGARHDYCSNEVKYTEYQSVYVNNTVYGLRLGVQNHHGQNQRFRGLVVGLLNDEPGITEGVQIGLINVNSIIRGLNVGATNSATKLMQTLGIGILYNDTADSYSHSADMQGLQIALWSNDAEGDTAGVQLAFFRNSATGTMRGGQIAIYNSGNMIKGVSVGIINHSDCFMKGMNVGVVNSADLTKGLQLGLFTYHPTLESLAHQADRVGYTRQTREHQGIQLLFSIGKEANLACYEH